MRAPAVAGVGGHDGGADAGRVTAGWWPDILVCRGTLDSLRRAAAVLETADPEAFPVLAVTLDAARAARRPIRAHLEGLEPHLGALVVLPYVRRWASLTVPVAEAAHLLAPLGRRARPILTRPLRAGGRHCVGRPCVGRPCVRRRCVGRRDPHASSALRRTGAGRWCAAARRGPPRRGRCDDRRAVLRRWR